MGLYMLISKNSKYGLIGSNISYSLSPKIYDFWLKRYNIEEQYSIIDINEDKLTSNLLMKYKGLNVTKPFKEKILSLVSSFSEEVNFIKSVNLLINDNSNIIGYNTDYLGLLDSYKYYNLVLKNKNILILGAGGGSRALLYSLLGFDCTIYLYNRTKEKIQNLINDFPNLKISAYKKNINCDIIFNTTSINFGDVLYSIGIKKCNNIIYYDLNYYHDSSDFKLNYVDGLYMLISQAKYNFYKFFGIMPDLDENIISYIKKK